MPIIRSIVLQCFCFKTNVVHFNRSGFFSFFDFSLKFFFLFDIASGAKLSFAPVFKFSFLGGNSGRLYPFC